MHTLHLVRQRLDEFLDRRKGVKHRLRPLYYAWQKQRYGRLISRNAALANRWKGQRCFVLGTAPSINEVDFGLLRDEHVFTCSLLFRHRDFAKLNASFYADTEPIQNWYRHSRRVLCELSMGCDGLLVTPHNHERALGLDYEIAADFVPNLAGEMRRVAWHYLSAIDRACSSPEALIFLNPNTRALVKRLGLFRGRTVHHVAKMAPPMDFATEQQNDLAGRFTFLNGVLFFAVASLIYMGFREIVLCGAGYTYEPQLCPHFYDTPIFSDEFSWPEAAVLIDKYATTRNLVVHRVDRETRGWKPMLVSPQPVDPKHAILKDFADASGVRIFNVVPEGFASPVYPAISWADVRDRMLAVTPTPITKAV